jgi:hypothetical protein
MSKNPKIFKKIKYKIKMNNTILTQEDTKEILKHINFSSYRKCIGQFENCLNVDAKEKFKGNFCKNCDNKKQLVIMNRKYSEKKLMEKMQNTLFLRQEQFEKIIQILDENQVAPFLKVTIIIPKPKLNIISSNTENKKI